MNESLSPVLVTLGRVARKLFLSIFVIFTFIVYAVHERLAGPDPALANALPAAPRPTATVLAPTAAPKSPTAAPRTNTGAATSQSAANRPAPTAAPAATDTAVPPTDVPATAAPTVASAGQYKDGTYTGSTEDAYYGLVQVEADVQNGQIADVKFLQYPHDRRTSQRINSIAMPYLTTEAIQAQNANVDIISGATLTSEAFAKSLQAALQGAAQ